MFGEDDGAVRGGPVPDQSEEVGEGGVEFRRADDGERDDAAATEA